MSFKKEYSKDVHSQTTTEIRFDGIRNRVVTNTENTPKKKKTILFTSLIGGAALVAASVTLVVVLAGQSRPGNSLLSTESALSVPATNWNQAIKIMVQSGASEEEINEYLAPYGLKYAKGYTYKAEDYFDLSDNEINSCNEYIGEVLADREDAEYDLTFCHDNDGKKWAFMICYCETTLELTFHSLLDREEIEEQVFVTIFDYHAPAES